MNTANKLTIFRVILVPVFMVFLLKEGFAWQMAALGVFVLASLTDMFDGQIARKRNQITTFGKFMDPLADKVLTTAAFVIFMQRGVINSWALMLILAREFMVAGIRLCEVGEGKVIAASFWGKFKTVSQMAAIIASILILNLPIIPEPTGMLISAVLIWISIFFTVISGIEYLAQNRHLLKLK